MANFTVTSGLSPAFLSGDMVTADRLNALGVPTIDINNIVNGDISNTAAIAGSKLADDSIVNAKIKSDAAIAYSKLNLSNSIVAGDLTAASVTPAKLSQPLTFATAQLASSSSSISFGSIPSWARRITVIFHNVFSSGTANFLVRVGGSVVESNGYTSFAARAGTSQATASASTGFNIFRNNASDVIVGLHMTITKINDTLWVSSHYGSSSQGANSFLLSGGGFISLGPVTLTNLTVSHGNQDTFSGRINICYE